MKQTRKFKLKINMTFIIIDIITTILIASTLPSVFNYPPFSEENAFQLQIESITHFQQYIVIGTLMAIVHLILAKILFGRIYKYLNKYYKNEPVGYKEILGIRKKCIGLPFYLLLFQTVVITLTVIILFAALTDNLNLIIRLSLYVFAIAYFVSLLLMSVLQILLRQVLIITYKNNNYDRNIGLRLNFSANLTTQVVPFLALSIITVSLISYNLAIQKNSDISFKYYKEKLDNITIDTDKINQEYLKNKLDTVELYNIEDYYFIQNSNGIYFSKEGKSNSTFFEVYLNMYYEEMEGKIFEYYGVEEEAYVSKLLDMNR